MSSKADGSARQRPSGSGRARDVAAAAAAAAGEQLSPMQQLEGHAQLLDWLVGQQGAAPSCLKVERRFAGPVLGWCLVATADIEPGEVRTTSHAPRVCILLGCCRAPHATAGISFCMCPLAACRRGPLFLPPFHPLPRPAPPDQRVHVILSVPLTAAITSEGADESRWSAAMAGQLLDKRAAAVAAAAAGDAAAAARVASPWLAALPAHVDLPWLYWSQAELAELQVRCASLQTFRFVFCIHVLP